VSAVYLLCVYYALYCALLCSVLCVLTMCLTVHFTDCIPESYLTKKLDTVSRRRFAFSSPSISVWITVWLSLFCALSRVSLYVCALIREREGERKRERVCRVSFVGQDAAAPHALTHAHTHKHTHARTHTRTHTHTHTHTVTRTDGPSETFWAPPRAHLAVFGQ